MKNKFLLLFSVILLLIGIQYLLSDKQEVNVLPKPTIIKEGEDEDNQDKRQQWFDLMHRSSPTTDWKAIELSNSQMRHKARLAFNNNQNATQRSGEEEIIPGALFGQWKERGSRNQAGSVLVTEYDSIKDSILTISAGGTLWRGTLDDYGWEVINQDLKFNGDLLKYIEGSNGRRLLAQSGRIPHYSDDDGLSWTPSTGIIFNDSWGATRHPIVLNNDPHTIYLFAKPDYWANISLYKSTDKGETYTVIHTFGQSDMNTYALCNPHGTDEVYLLVRNSLSTEIYIINQITNDIELISSNSDFTMGNVRGNLIGTQFNDTTRFYVYDQSSIVHQTEDFGLTWEEKGTIPAHPWGVGMYVLPSNPDLLITGGLECHRSYDGGQNWFLMNGWGAYYGNPDIYLHADMMYFKEFEHIDGDHFILVSNHGGLNISWDNMMSVSNIGKQGLNVGQFYDVTTDPLNKNYVYAGSQDQGFQRGFAFSPNQVMEMDQVISGDYGHTVFTQNGVHLWTVYPGGWVSYYGNPQTDGGPSTGFTVESENESVWIPPLLADPNPLADVVYLAGGSVDGGPGSFIIKLEQSNNNVNATQLPFDFKAETDSEVSALACSPINPDHWYAATTNGRFFSSTDRGLTWEQTINFLPSGHYLYGAAIYPSKVDENTVYFAGSGYSNPAVYKSTDNGLNFFAMNDGLPATLVFDLDGDDDEHLLYAATEAGPYVYSHLNNQWYDLAGLSAPTQTYWSVEYLEDNDSRTVRYGTYGRGAWDFQITQLPVATKQLIENQDKLAVFPNPSKGTINIKVERLNHADGKLEIHSMDGKLVYKKQLDYNSTEEVLITLDLHHLTKGTYIVSTQSAGEIRSQQLVLQ